MPRSMRNPAYLSCSASGPRVAGLAAAPQNTSCEKAAWMSLSMATIRKIEFFFSAYSSGSKGNTVMKSIIICFAIDAALFSSLELLNQMCLNVFLDGGKPWTCHQGSCSGCFGASSLQLTTSAVVIPPNVTLRSLEVNEASRLLNISAFN